MSYNVKKVKRKYSKKLFRFVLTFFFSTLILFSYVCATIFGEGIASTVPTMSILEHIKAILALIGSYDVTNLSSLFGSLIVAIPLYLFVNFYKNKKIVSLAAIGVRYASQILIGGGKGEEKKVFVQNYIKKALGFLKILGVKKIFLDSVIESAVNELSDMKKYLGESVKPAIK